MEPNNGGPLVIYHAHCADGAAAAYAAYLKLGDAGEYVAQNYSDPPPTIDDVAGRDVYILDFSYKREVLERLAQAAHSLTVLDHHKTAAAELRGLPYAHFAMCHSGAVLAWKFFHGNGVSAGNLGNTLDVPDLYRYVQDRDLWLWKELHSQEVNAAIAASGVKEDFKRFRDLPSIEKLAMMGGAILLANNATIGAICKNASTTLFDGYSVLVVNSPVFQSEVGERLAAGRPFGMVWYADSDGVIRVSLRADANGADVSEIAKRYGGGGHARAAGFEIPFPLNPFERVA